MRARNIKPGLFLNSKLGTSDPLYTVIFEGLWCIADRAGRLVDDPMKIHATVNPYRHYTSTVQALCWLSAQGFISRYMTDDGSQYITIPKFSKHQNPHIREAPSILPDESGFTTKSPPYDLNGTSTVLAPVEHRTSPADSGFLIPDSPSLIPDSGLPEHSAETEPDPKLTRHGYPVGLSVDVWNLYLDHRSAMGKPAPSKPEAILRTQLALAAMPELDQLAVVQQAIDRGETALRPLQPSTGESGTSTRRAPKPPPRKRCPESFEVTDAMRAWAAENAPDVDLQRETAKFRDHEFAKGRTDWPATWRNWMREAQDRVASRRPGNGSRPAEPTKFNPPPHEPGTEIY